MEIPELPEECRIAKTCCGNYNGQVTHAATLLRWLTSEWTSAAVTPEEIRQATDLSKEQFKEAKKNPEIRRFFENNIYTIGSGKNTVYHRKKETTEL